jgi:hypothetical protein
MTDITVQLEPTGAVTTSPLRRPPPPVFPNRVYLQCSAEGKSVSAATLTIPSLPQRKAESMAAVLREAADQLVSASTVRRAGSPKDPGVTIDLLAVLRK